MFRLVLRVLGGWGAVDDGMDGWEGRWVRACVAYDMIPRAWAYVGRKGWSCYMLDRPPVKHNAVMS
jgi:hypothetical protein